MWVNHVTKQHTIAYLKLLQQVHNHSAVKLYSKSIKTDNVASLFLCPKIIRGSYYKLGGMSNKSNNIIKCVSLFQCLMLLNAFVNCMQTPNANPIVMNVEKNKSSTLSHSLQSHENVMRTDELVVTL